MNILKIARTADWNSVLVDANKTALASAMSDLAIFSSIYVPVKTPTAAGMPDDFTYTNVGMLPTELADAYETLYGSNYLSVPFVYMGTGGYTQSRDKLKAKIQSVYKLNKYKYLKMLELLGYSYNPLYNVDGVEAYTYIENNGTVDTTLSKSYAQHIDSVSGSNIKTGNVANSGTESHDDTNSVTSFDNSEFSNTDHNTGNKTVTGDTTTYNNVTDTVSNSTTYGAHTDTDTTTVTHHNAKNGESDYSGGTDLFGNTVYGGDMYHNEMRERKGNIGVTKTQELIEAERNNLRFSLIQEFFEDINKYILVGIYDI